MSGISGQLSGISGKLNKIFVVKNDGKCYDLIHKNNFLKKIESMKYILKIKKKVDSTVSIAVYADEYKEFNNITNIIEHIYKNSVFIDSYEIYKLEPFEKTSDQSNISCEKGNIVFHV